MTTADLAARPLAVALVASPVLALAAEAVSPSLKSDDLAQLSVIAAHPDQWYAYSVLLIVSSVLLVPATVAVMRVTRSRAARLSLVGGVVFAYGAVIATGDAMSQLMTWQMAAPGADPHQMAALQDRFDSAGGAALVFAPGGLGFLLGSVVLMVALLRSRAVARWVGVAFLLGNGLQFAGFTASSVLIVTVGDVVQLLAFTAIALRLWRVGRADVPEEARERPFVPAI